MEASARQLVSLKGAGIAAAVLATAWLLGRPATLTARLTNGRATLSIVGTTDLHGYVFPRGGRGGLALLGGYVRNLREARTADGGAVLLLDAGDTYQGGIESNLTEGGLVIDAYNALGYAAGAIGNHDFDFGVADGPGARQPAGADPRGAIKARALQARFPLLAANLVDDETGRSIDWRNVRPSAMVTAAGVTVGIVGVMTIDAMRATLPDNVRGLRVTPLAPAIEREARALRTRGARVVVVAAHAGGGCTRFDDPADLGSCDRGSEIFQVADGLSRGLVDLIVAGHTHDGLAHRVNGVTIVQGYSLGRAFARADIVVDRVSETVVDVTPHAPRELCGQQEPGVPGCSERFDAPRAVYEGREVVPDPGVAAAMEPALAHVRTLREAPLGVTLATPLERGGDLESPLGNLFADALREHAGADVALHTNLRGGLRADLPPGPLTFGHLYDVFPFDNRLARLTLTGADLKRALAGIVATGRRGWLGISGLRVRASCAPDGLSVDLLRPTGQPVDPGDRFDVVAIDSLLAGPAFSAFIAPAARMAHGATTIVREAVEDWLRRRGGQLSIDQFFDPARRRWEYPESVPADCQ